MYGTTYTKEKKKHTESDCTKGVLTKWLACSSGILKKPIEMQTTFTTWTSKMTYRGMSGMTVSLFTHANSNVLLHCTMLHYTNRTIASSVWHSEMRQRNQTWNNHQNYSFHTWIATYLNEDYASNKAKIIAANWISSVLIWVMHKMKTIHTLQALFSFHPTGGTTMAVSLSVLTLFFNTIWRHLNNYSIFVASFFISNAQNFYV